MDKKPILENSIWDAAYKRIGQEAIDSGIISGPFSLDLSTDKLLKIYNAFKNKSNLHPMTVSGLKIIDQELARRGAELNEASEPVDSELWSRAKAAAKAKFDVYPSAYANAWAVKWYQDKGGEWKGSKEKDNVTKAVNQIDESLKNKYKQITLENFEKILKIYEGYSAANWYELNSFVNNAVTKGYSDEEIIQRVFNLINPHFTKEIISHLIGKARSCQPAVSIIGPDVDIKKNIDLYEKDLEEQRGRRGRPRKDGTSSEDPEDTADLHIIMQLRKIVVLDAGKGPNWPARDVYFADGSYHKVTAAEATKALNKYNKMFANRQAGSSPDTTMNFLTKLAKNYDSFVKTINEETIEEGMADVKVGAKFTVKPGENIMRLPAGKYEITKDIPGKTVGGKTFSSFVVTNTETGQEHTVSKGNAQFLLQTLVEQSYYARKFIDVLKMAAAEKEDFVVRFKTGEREKITAQSAKTVVDGYNKLSDKDREYFDNNAGKSPASFVTTAFKLKLM